VYVDRNHFVAYNVWEPLDALLLESAQYIVGDRPTTVLIQRHGRYRPKTSDIRMNTFKVGTYYG